jgi:uncharacterized protein YndB with AHSA1/START domain
MAGKTEISATPGGYEIVITRVLDAPVDKVWRAYHDPELVKQWLGPRRLESKINTWEMKPGGRWSMTHHDPEANMDFDFTGFVIDIKEKERSVRTFEFSGVPGHISFETAVFEDLGDKTKVVATSVFQSPEDRDGMLQSGMEEGVTEGFERLDELLPKI